MAHRRSSAIVASALTVFLTSGCSGNGDGDAASDPIACERAAAASLRACIRQANDVERSCYTGGPCPQLDLSDLENQVRSQCPDAAVQGAGYGPLFTTDALVQRLLSSCSAEVASIAARSFGGPHGAVLNSAGDDERDCLGEAHRQATMFLDDALAIQSDCIEAERAGTGCDPSAVADEVAALESETADRITGVCGALENLVAVDGATYVARAAAQSRCITATAHPDVFPLELDCGPRQGIGELPRGEYAQVVLDEAVWGTRCGDGSPFAFQVRLAPEGHPVENVLVGMQGGGVCIFENDCAGRPADLFEALNDLPPQSGIFSNDPAVSPFANWTKVYLPYCNQDVFAGGGATSNFPSITVHRFGAVNVRAALRYVRDVLWRELDRSTAEGYRHDRPRVLFGGFSAGAFGTLYNYHWVLDDLQWVHTQAYPDAGLALDNGQALGIASLGILLTTDAPPLGWGSRNHLPPYCFATNCGVGPILLEATAPRLKRVPDQQFLILSNQVDLVQVGTTFFPSTASWINAMRASYCSTRDLPGVHYYLPAIAENLHVISLRPNLYTDTPVDGVLMRDWLAGAVSDPDGVQNRVEEGALTDAYAGVEPFPCALAQ
jgi:hypothetical protein